MKKKITPKDSEYDNLVEKGDNQYAILTSKLERGQSVQCPNDPDMEVEKSSEGTILLRKKAYSKDCFVKSP